MEEKRGFGLCGTIIIIVVTALISSMATGVILFQNVKTSSPVAYTSLSNDKALQEFVDVYASIISDYYEDVDKEGMVSNAINAMFNYLGDAYSQYMTKEQSEALAQKLQGEYEGIGVQIATGNVIDDVFDNSPAKSSGIQKGDVIVKINGTNVEKNSISEVANIIKNSKTNQVEITLRRGSEEKVVTVIRKKMYVPSIHYETKEYHGKKVGYLVIETFSNTLAEQVTDALSVMEQEGISSLIIDVRNNSGGYLNSANKVASMFLEQGKIIYSLQNKEGTIHYKDETSMKKDYPVAVLINGYSASASEILAAALKESYGAILVGEKSYGKGKVQQTMELDNGSMVKYTSSKWLTPSGNCIDKVGLTPDTEVTNEVNEEGFVMKDLQLEKALEIITED